MIKILTNYPKDLLERIDKYANRKGWSRAQTIRKLITLGFTTLKPKRKK